MNDQSKPKRAQIQESLSLGDALEYAESIINTVREPLIILDKDLRVVKVSRSFYEFFKVKPEETVGQLIYDLGNRQWDIPKLRELLETILPQKTTFDNYEVEHDFAAIGKHIMLLNARQIQRVLSKEKVILLAIEDITERKRLESLLIDSEEQYRRLFETTSDGIVFLEQREGKITHANPATEKMLGYTKKELIGNKLQDIGVLLDMGGFQTTMQNLDKSGIIHYNDVSVRTKSGQQIDTDIDLVDKATLVLCSIRDITERKKAEKALRESEEKYRWMLNNMADVVVVMDMNLRFTYVSPSIIRMRGYTAEEAMAQTIEQVMTPESLQIVAKVFEEEMKLEASGTADPARSRIVEVEEYRKDGSIVLMENHLSFMRDETQKAVGIISLTHDITERKRAEEAIKDAQTRYRLLFEHSPDGIVIIDPDTARLLEFNETAHRQLGYSREEFARLSISDFDAFETPEETRLKITKVIQEGRNDFETLHRTRQGEIKNVHVTAQITEMLGKPVYHCIWRDITKSKRAELKLKQQADAMDAATDGMAILNEEGEYIYVNKAHAKIYGYESEGELIGKSWRILYNPDVIQRFDQEFMPEFSRKGYWFGESIGKKENGSEFPQELSLTAMANGGLICVVRDITESKRAEEELKESEKKYRLLADNIQDVIFVLDMNLKYTYISPSVKLLRGYEPKEVLEQSIEQTLTPSSHNLASKAFSETMELEKSEHREISMSRTLLLEMKRKDGSTVWTDVKFSFIRDENQRIMGIMGVTRDITERKQAEEELKQSEVKYRTILESIQEGYFELDLAGNYTFVNEANCRFLEYTKKELVGMNYRQHMNEENAKKLYQPYYELYRTGKPIELLEVESFRKDGTKVINETSVSLIRDAADNPIGFRGVSRDITKHVEMEEKIRQSEERFRSIIEQMEDGYFEVDLAGKFTFVNDAQCRTLGYTREELIGRDNMLSLDETMSAKSAEIFQKKIDTGQSVVSYNLKVTKKDGTESYSELSVYLMRDPKGDPIGFRGISHDVTERKLADIKLRNYSEEIGELYNNAPCGYHSLGPDGIFTRVNDTELKWLGYERDEIVGKIKWGDLLTEASRIDYYQYWPVLKERGWLNDREYDLIRKDGSSFSVMRNALAIRDEKGNFIGSRAIIFDISEIKKTRSALEAANLELFNAYEELQKRQEMIIQQEKMASIGMLAAGVAHEIKNPLAIIIQGVYYLQKTVKDSPLLIEVIERLNKAVSRADMIVKGLLRYSRQTPISLVKQDIVALVDESLVLTEHEFRAKNIQVTKKYQPNLAEIPVDDNQIKQVFVNLIINAIHAMSQKGRLTVTARQLEDDGGKKFIQLSFEDTGHGIPADKIKNVFDPFYTTKAVGSTGLGLSISKGIIDMHGGTIYAESPEGEGAKFIIQLPLT